MEKGTDRIVVKVARLVIVVSLVFIAFIVGRASCMDAAEWTPPEPDYTTYTADELSWVREGIMERISELEDELERVTDMMGIDQ